MIPCPRCGDLFNPHESKYFRPRICLECCGQTDKDPVRLTARNAVANAVRLGLFPPASYFDCTDCGKPAMCYDHRNYFNPLGVDPVCKSCDVLRGPGYPPLPNRHGARDWAVAA